jgi:hypothetical protein
MLLIIRHCCQLISDLKNHCILPSWGKTLTENLATRMRNWRRINILDGESVCFLKGFLPIMDIVNIVFAVLIRSMYRYSKKQEFNLTDKQKLLLGFALGLLGFVLGNLYYDSFEKLYTIGEVTGTSTGLKSGTSVQFEFYRAGRKIEGSCWKGSYSAKEGQKFVVEFGRDKHSISSILLYYPVPETWDIQAPREEWSSIPDEIKSHRLKRTEDFGMREFFHRDK